MASSILNVTPENDLNKYLQEIRKFPLLTPEEEINFSKKWKENGDVEAAHHLVTSHLRLVAKIAMGYRGYGLPLNELISEGNVGMLQAVRRFDPDRGFRLATYAIWWIRAAIQEYILHSWSLVKMGTTAAQKKLFFNLRRIKGQIQAFNEGDIEPEQLQKIATTLGVTEDEVLQMDRRLSSVDHSLNSTIGDDQDGGEWQNMLVDETENQEANYAKAEEFSDRQTLLRNAMKDLNDRERYILTERRLNEEPVTLEELSKKYNISRERVRQIEVRAFEKLQKAMKSEVEARRQKHSEEKLHALA
ncbi:MAG: RNA polymerase sigma factor RpoH [Commensalibacter sp.]|nr:RNA polymerase sigma factor RpoH [Commensalibacter sp.]